MTYVWTHDSVGLGEDGPTHQPVEHYAALRAIPNLWFVRPGDANEAAAAWALAVERPTMPGAQPGPVALAFTRQKLPTLAGSPEQAREGLRRGGYVLREASGGSPQLILIGTGSELQLAFAAAEQLEADGIPTRVVSLPCWERFEAQDEAYIDSVLPPSVKKRVSVEIRRLPGLGALGRRRGRDHRPRPLRRERPGRHDLQGVRVHGGTGRGRRPARGPRRPPRPPGRRSSSPHGSHPTIGDGDAGVDRTPGSDPGHG